MSYEVLERKFRSLPQESFAEVSSFFDYMLYKFGKLQSDNEQECMQDNERMNALCDKMNEETEGMTDATVMCMREALKDDAW